MKRIGLLGGMSWESSLEYYRLINENVKKELGETHSADCLMYSFDFHVVETLQHNDEWDKLTEMLVVEANHLKAGGAEFIVICTNTMHKMAHNIEAGSGLKVLHIADATADTIVSKGMSKVLLLGTKFTMESDFYRERLEVKGIEVMIPDVNDRNKVHQVIYNELVLGQIKDESRKAYQAIIKKAALQGAEGVVLGCTEIPLLIQQNDVSIEVFDTTELHSKAAVEYALT